MDAAKSCSPREPRNKSYLVFLLWGWCDPAKWLSHKFIALGPEGEGGLGVFVENTWTLHSSCTLLRKQKLHKHCCLSAGQNFFRSSFLTPDSHLVLLKGLHLMSCGRGLHGRQLNKVQIKRGKHIFWGSILKTQSSKNKKSHVLPVIFYCMP